MRRSTFTTITRHNKQDISDFEARWRANNLPGPPQSAWSGRFFNFPYKTGRKITRFENTGQP
jgi:hypothetical protein